MGSSTWANAREGELSPCPFCSEAKLYMIDEIDEWYANCGCGARGPVAESRPEAAQAWNERPLLITGTGIISNEIGAERVDCTQGE